MIRRLLLGLLLAGAMACVAWRAVPRNVPLVAWAAPSPDARRLAEKHGDDPRKWNDVAYWLMQKSKREIYTDPVVKYGFSRGIEPVTYVAVILDRYDHYRQYVVKQSESGDR